MPAGKHKSGRYRKVFVKTPGGKTTIHYRERKPSASKCAIFGTKLSGVPRERPAKLGKLSKSARRPERPYGGVLSSRGMRVVIREQARMEYETSNVEGPEATEVIDVEATESEATQGGEQ